MDDFALLGRGPLSQHEVCDSLWHLPHQLRSHVIVVWDDASFHDSASLTELCCASQLNLIEAAWRTAKHPLANGRPEDIFDLGRAPRK